MKFNDIIIQDRQRVDYGNIDELAESLLTMGFIQPIVVNQEKQLIAGGRRSRALAKLFDEAMEWEGLPENIHPTMVGLFQEGGELTFGVHYIIKDTEGEDQLTEYELEENVQRKNMSWQEQVLCITKIYEIKRAHQIKNGLDWSQKTLGKLIGVSRATISYALKLSAWLREDGQHPVWKCRTLTEALQWEAAKFIQEGQKKLAESTKEDLAAMRPVEIVSETSASLLSQLGLGDQHSELITSPAETPSERNEVERMPVVEEKKPKQVFELSKMISLGDCHDVMRGWGAESVDHIITDPPYGIDMANMVWSEKHEDLSSVEQVKETHDVEENKESFHKWLEDFYYILKPNGFCFLWYDLDHHERLQALATSVGFKVQKWPFIWKKTSPCQNRAPHQNTTKDFEVGLLLRKGTPRLVRPRSTSFWEGSAAEIKRELPDHPFVKPTELTQHIAEMFALPGQTIADPFSGVGSITRALVKGGYKTLGAEIDEVFWARQVEGFKEYYTGLLGEVEFK